MYPVDLPAVNDTDLTSASEQYISSLESRPPNNELFQSSQASKVTITANNVRRLQLFEDDQPDCTLLVLHPPDDPTRVVALYLHEKWWCVDDVLRTSSKSRSGLMLVQSIMERVIVFLLSQVVEKSSQEEVLFSLHPRTESCRLLWRDSQAVGFYAVKHKGSLCDSWSSHCYLLPVLDTVLVRRSWRRRGFGLQMLEDFCSSFSTEKFVGVSSPLSPSMVAVCKRFLQQHGEHQERLYEVEAPGGWTQRRNIWLNIQLGRYSLSINEESSPASGKTQRNEGDDSSQKAMYPVDLPAVNDTDLTSASEQYISSLESRPPNNELFQSSQASKVTITANNVRRLQLFEDDQPDCTLLVLHPPDDPTRVVALYLHEKWWCVDDVLRTSSKSRSGLMLVQSIMERVIVFLLSQVVEKSSQEEVLFSLHPRTESCRLLWRDSQAVGFYAVKHKGSLCDSWSSHCYLLPVLDTVLVRRSWRRRGFGLQMLEDFCSSFSTEKFVGVSSPLSPSMVAVCKRFLQQHGEHQERLYEVEAPGGWTQRRNIWLNIQLGRYSLSINEESSPASGKTQRNEGDDSSQKMQTYNCRLDLASLSTCNVNIPLAIGSSEQQIKACDPSQGGSSPSSEISGTGCSPAAHADDPDSGPPTRPPQSLNIKQALISKPSLSAEPCREKPEAEETQRSAKRVRRT